MSYPIVLSYVQAESLLNAKRLQEASLQISPNLGITTITVKLSDATVEFPGGERVQWVDIEKIKKATTNCFIIKEEGIQTIQTFSEYTNRVCSLLPTKRTPGMLIAGFTMHRIVDIDPMQGMLKMIATIAPITGHVLDTATGLGYTAIEAAKTAERVITIELDPGAQEIAKLNPWSRNLFNNPKIQQIMGDAFEVVPTFEDNSFDRIMHDPPVFSLAGELYSGAFYQQLYRVLKHGGRLFHYIGNLESKSSGTVTKGVLKRLQAAGFTRIMRRPEAFGVVAYK
jgi:uncharacterized protein